MSSEYQPDPQAGPPPAAAPAAPQGGGGIRLQDIMQIAAPVVGAYISSFNPAAGRAVETGARLADMGMNWQQQKQKIAAEQRQNDLAAQRAKGTIQGIDSLNKEVDGYKNILGSRMQDLGNGLTTDAMGEDKSLPNGLNPQSVRMMDVYRQQANLAAQSGDYSSALKSANAAYGVKAQMAPQDIINQVGQLPPGAKMSDVPNLYGGKLEFGTPTAKYVARDQSIIAPQGAKGPMGEDLSGQPVIVSHDENTGTVKYLGAKNPKEMNVQPFTVINDPNASPEQKAEAYRVLAIEHPKNVGTQIYSVDDRKAAVEQIAQGLANGDLSAIKDISSMRGDQRMMIYARAKQLNPQFNTANLNSRIKTYEDFTSGKGAQSIQSFGTFLEHAGAANDALDSMYQSGSPMVNKPMNYIRQNMAGDPSVTRLNASLAPVGKEFESFLLNNNALHDDDRRQIDTILNSNSSPAQIKQALNTMSHTAEARYTEMNHRYSRVVGQPLPSDAFSPEAIEGARKVGVSIGGESVQGPGRGGAPISSAGSHAPASYKYVAEGPNGARMGSNDGKTWATIK